MWRSGDHSCTGSISCPSGTIKVPKLSDQVSYWLQVQYIAQGQWMNSRTTTEKRRTWAKVYLIHSDLETRSCSDTVVKCILLTCLSFISYLLRETVLIWGAIKVWVICMFSSTESTKQKTNVWIHGLKCHLCGGVCFSVSLEYSRQVRPESIQDCTSANSKMKTKPN